MVAFPRGSKARRAFCGVVGQPRKPLPRVRLVLDPAAAPVRAAYTRRTEPPARPWLREARLAAGLRMLDVARHVGRGLCQAHRLEVLGNATDPQTARGIAQLLGLTDAQREALLSRAA